MGGLANSVTEEMLQQHLRSKIKGSGDAITIIQEVIEPIDQKRQCGEDVIIQGGFIDTDGLLYNAVNPTKPIDVIIAEEGDEGDWVRCIQGGDLMIPGTSVPPFDTGMLVYFAQSNLALNLTTDLPVYNPGEAMQIVGKSLSTGTMQVEIEQPEYLE